MTEEENYSGLDIQLERFKTDFRDEKERLLFSIAYKLGMDKSIQQIEKSLPSDDELENIKGLENRGIVVYLRMRTKEAINKLKKG